MTEIGGEFEEGAEVRLIEARQRGQRFPVDIGQGGRRKKGEGLPWACKGAEIKDVEGR